MTLRLAVLSSHGGTNLGAILDACVRGTIDAEVRLVLSNNPGSGAIRRAEAAGIPAVVVNGRTHPEPDERDAAMAELLTASGAAVVCLAGYMKLIGPRTLAAFQDRILNVHPALLPRFGGQGMFGEHVHRAVLAAGERATGVTIHLVDAEYDHGPVVAQRADVAVMPDDTPETLGGRVLAAEHAFYVETLGAIASGAIDLDAVAVGGGP